MVRTQDDARTATNYKGSSCGNGKGGSSKCVSEYWQRKDGNKSISLVEEDVEQEIRTNGPVAVGFTVRADFIDHINSGSSEPYEENPDSLIKSQHATTITGYGRTKDGRRYWKCHDSNKDPNGNFLEYRIYKGKSNLRNFFGQRIDREIPINKERKEKWIFGQETEEWDANKLFWDGYRD